MKAEVKQKPQVRSQKSEARMRMGAFVLIIIFYFLAHPASFTLAQFERRDRRADATAPQTNAREAGEAVVTLNERFVNSLLDALLAQPRPPTFPLSLARADRTGESPAATLRSEANHSFNNQGCASEISLLRESGGVRTEVRFRDRAITAPIAFRGSYNAGLLGCVRFQGWANTEINLSFDRARQRLVARVTVREVNLSGVPGLASGFITGMVQNSLDERINPIEILRAEQLGTRIPVPDNAPLQLRAREVQPEISNNELRLRIFYEVVQAR